MAVIIDQDGKTYPVRERSTFSSMPGVVTKTGSGANLDLRSLMINQKITLADVPDSSSRYAVPRIDTSGMPIINLGSSHYGALTVSNLIATNLSAVSAYTGSLTVNGALTVGNSGNIHSGQTSWDVGTGWWLEYNSGSPRASMGNHAGSHWTWDSSSFKIYNGSGVLVFDSSGLNGNGVNFNQDNVRDGSTFVRGSSQLRNTGTVEISNGLFQQGSGQFSSSNFVLPGWSAPSAGDAYFQTTGPTPQFGTQYLVLKSTSTTPVEIDCLTKWACRPGDIVTIGGTVAEAVSPTAAQVFANFYDKNMAFLTSVAYNPGTTSFSQGSASLTAPANTAWVRPGVYLNPTAANQFGLYNEIWMSINDARVPNAGKAYIDFTDGTSGGHVGKNVDNLADGSTYARIKGSELSSGVHKLTVAASGSRLADQRNNVPVVGGGSSTSAWSGMAFTPHPTSMNIASGTLLLGSSSVSYSSSSKTGLANSTAYSFYFQDPTFAGGSQTLFAANDSITGTPVGRKTMAQNDGVIYIGDGTTQTGGGTGGGGGIGPCVEASMFLHPRRRARVAHDGDMLDCSDGFKIIGKRPIGRIVHKAAHCVRLESSNGCALVCSECTPFTLEDGSTALAPDMLGKKVLTDLGESDITKLEHIGTLTVMRIYAGGISFAAGEDGAKRIYSHNGQKP